MTTKPKAADPDKMLAMNEALILGAVRQHELTSDAEAANARLQVEIAERKQAEAASRESERRYRTLFDLGPVAVYSCDTSGLIQQYNPRAEELWGRKPDPRDTAQRFCGSLRLFHSDGAVLPHENCPMAKVACGKLSSAHDQEVIIERPDGSRVTVVVNIAPLKNDQGKTTGAINCFYDITERKRAEEARSRLAVVTATNQRLELEVEQRRTAQAALQASEQRQKQLLAASRRMRDQLRLLSRQVLSAQEEERKRISRELHDVIAQTLTGISVRVASLKLDAKMTPKERELSITRTQQLLEQSVNAVHQFARELRPAVLDDIGLIPALCALMKGFKQDTGIHASLSSFAAAEDVDNGIKVAFYRIAQEALANVARHAQADRVEVHILKVGGALCMKITDNGKGFAQTTAKRGEKNQRLGLLGMRERLEMVGGKFVIQSASGKGTTVVAEVPLAKFRSNARNGEPKARK